MELIQYAYIPLVILMGTGWGLISLWAITSPLPWWVRSCVCGLLLSLFFRIPAYEPILFFSLQFVTILIGVSFWSHLRGGQFASRTFSLRTLLLAMVMAGILLSVVIRTTIPSATVWLALIAGSVSLGITTLLAARIAFFPWNWRRLFAVFGTIVGLAIPMGQWDAMLLNFPEWDRTATTFELFLAYSILWAIVLTTTLLLISTGLLGARQKHLPTERTDGKPNANWLGGFCTAFVVCLVSIPTLIVFLRVPAEIPTSNLADRPNCYTELVKVRDLYVEFGAFQHPAIASEKELVVAVEKNERVFAQFRQALTLPFHPTTELDMMTMLSDVNFLRSFTRAVLADALLAQRQGRIDHAVTDVLDVVKLAHKIDDSNLMVSFVSDAIEAMAMPRLTGLRPDLNDEQSQRIIDFLGEIDANSTSLEEILEADRAWAQQQWGWRTQLYHALYPFVSAEGPLAEATSGYTGARCRSAATRHLIITELAIQLYAKQHGGDLPFSLHDLTIDRNLLTDPYATDGAMLKYDSTTPEFLLYSVGPDGFDDSGRPMPSTESLGDFLSNSAAQFMRDF